MTGILLNSSAVFAGETAKTNCPEGCNCDYGAPECYYVKIDAASKLLVIKRKIRADEISNLVKELQGIQAKVK